LAVGLFAEWAAVLVGHADRVLALLGKASVIHHPGLKGAVPFQGRQHVATDGGQHGGIVPVRVGHQVRQRLVAGADVAGIQACRHRLHAFALTGQQQAHGVEAHGFVSIGMAEHVR
jgi:hypothetical protein